MKRCFCSIQRDDRGGLTLSLKSNFDCRTHIRTCGISCWSADQAWCGEFGLPTAFEASRLRRRLRSIFWLLGCMCVCPRKIDPKPDGGDSFGRHYRAAARRSFTEAGRSTTAAYVFHCGVRSRIFCAERVNDFAPLQRRCFGRCGFTRGHRRRHLIVASKPRRGLGYRLALRGLCDRGLRKQAK